MGKLKLMTLKLCFFQNNEYIVQALNPPPPISYSVHVLHSQHLKLSLLQVPITSSVSTESFHSRIKNLMLSDENYGKGFP